MDFLPVKISSTQRREIRRLACQNNAKDIKNWLNGGRIMHKFIMNMNMLKSMKETKREAKARKLTEKSDAAQGGSQKTIKKCVTNRPLEKSSPRDASCSNKKQRTDAPSEEMTPAERKRCILRACQNNTKYLKNWSNGGLHKFVMNRNMLKWIKAKNMEARARKTTEKSGSTGGVSQTNIKKCTTKRPSEQSSPQDACSNKKRRTDAPPS